MKQLWQLFWSFARIGVCTFGGGYAMLPFIQAEIVEKKKWATNEEIMDYYIKWFGCTKEDFIVIE